MRTMQSGYCEIMGLYPPELSGAAKLTQGMLDNLNEGIGMPPFNVRDANKINTQLGFAALPDNFMEIPIYTFMNDDINDDASHDGCPWISN